MTGITGYFAVATTPLLLAVMAAAQSPPLEAVDQQVDDVSALGLSLRQVQTSLQQPNDFSELYRSPYDDDHLARIQGGLYAVFPRSTYAVDKEGSAYASVPPGTVFYIGPPPGWTLPTAFDTATARNQPDTARIEGRLTLRITPGLMAGAMSAWHAQVTEPVPEPEPRRYRFNADTMLPILRPATRMVRDPDYRAQRVRALMHDAAQASRPDPQ